MESNIAIDIELFLEPTPPAAGSARRALDSAAIFGVDAEPDALLLCNRARGRSGPEVQRDTPPTAGADGA